MQKQKGFGLIGILIIIGTLILTAGGVVVWEKKGSPTVAPTPSSTPAAEFKPTISGPVTPGISKDVKDLPTAVPVTTTPFSGGSGEIQTVFSKSLYRKGEELEIQVSNNSAQTVSYFEGPRCGVYFERKVDTKWQPQHLCFACFWASSKAPCFPKTIASNTWIKIVRLIENQTPSGTYRAVFHYVNGTVYSSELKIL